MLTTALTLLRRLRGGRGWSILVLVLVGLLSLAACKPDRDLSDQPVPTPPPPVTPPTPPVEICRPLPPVQNWSGEYYTRSIGQIHSWPLVEPVPNGRYLHFAGVPDGPPVYQFPVYSATGHLLNTLRLAAFDPSVSSRGWLTYWDLGGQIWKVKLNGDSLTLLPDPSGAFSSFPRWLPNGRQLVVNRRYDVSDTYYQLVVLNEAGGVARVLTDSRRGDLFFALTGKWTDELERLWGCYFGVWTRTRRCCFSCTSCLIRPNVTRWFAP
ncbi:MAG: hypothetical protein H7330_09775, partial [Hymenobacteraceae bacterium]|nr:hypothetical protein [Hymenobacteraceae bacterium]